MERNECAKALDYKETIPAYMEIEPVLRDGPPERKKVHGMPTAGKYRHNFRRPAYPGIHRSAMKPHSITDVKAKLWFSHFLEEAPNSGLRLKIAQQIQAPCKAAKSSKAIEMVVENKSHRTFRIESNLSLAAAQLVSEFR